MIEQMEDLEKLDDESKDSLEQSDSSDDADSSGEQERFSDSRLDASEQTALNYGWVPKEKYKGDPKKWVDADEFLRRGELFAKIASQNQQIGQLRQVVQGLQEHLAKVKETEFKKALEKLKEEKVYALKEGDHERVLSIDDEIEQVRETKEKELSALETSKVTEQQAVAQQLGVTFAAWKQRNNWYSTDEVLHDYADAYGLRLARSSPGVSYEDILSEVERKVLETFPERFNRRKGSKVDGGGSGSKTSTALSKLGRPLTKEEQKMMDMFVAEGVMTRDEYIKDLIEMERNV